MGSEDSRSKFEHGSWALQTDKPYYAPGEIITEKIYLNLQQAYPGIYAWPWNIWNRKCQMGGQKASKARWLFNEFRNDKDLFR